jgi:hypothetical protein
MTTDTRSRIVDLARATLGSTGPEPWAREAGMKLGPNDKPSWCGLWSRAMLRRAGLTLPDWRMGFANLEYLRKLPDGARAQPGDIGFVTEQGHQAIIVEDDGTSVRSVDGNGKGAQVVERIRPRRDYAAFYSIDPLLKSNQPGIPGSSNGGAPVDNRGAPVSPAPANGGAPVDPFPRGYPFRGLDVSAYQSPTALDYSRAKAMGFSFVYARGVRMGRELDRTAKHHVERARAAGLRVGLYAFFHPAETVEHQLQLIRDAHDLCGVGLGDLAPVLDLESVEGGVKATAAWVPAATAILDGMAARFGCAVRYHNVVDWLAMGSPKWLHPLWLAAYRSTPPTNAGDWAIWQHASALVPCLSMILDQNVAKELHEIRVPLPGPEPVIDTETHLRASMALAADRAANLAHDARSRQIAENTERGLYDATRRNR